MVLWRVRLTSKGYVDVCRALDTSLWSIDQVIVMECLDDSNKYSHDEFRIYLRACDVDHALERAMPSLKVAQARHRNLGLEL